MENGLSLTNIGAVVREQLMRLDFASGDEYLTGVTNSVLPLQEKIESARDELSELIARANAADDTAALRSINDRTVEAASLLFESVNSVPMVQELCTAVRDAIAGRALELSRRELYLSGIQSDLSLALLAVGSDGRREQLLFTDQDYLFLHEGKLDSFQPDEAMADYFGILGSIFVTKMDEIGISKCSGGIMPVNDDWRGSLPQWEDRLAAMFRFERGDWEKNILNLIALMDTRFVCGDPELGLEFGKMVRLQVRNNSQAIRHMARTVSSMKLSKGFLRRFVVEGEGAHKGEFNLKVLAWMPLVMCIRLLAVSVGIEDTSTVKRISRLRKWGHLTERTAADLTDAYLLITRYRILQQNRRLKRIIDDDCYLNPYELPRNEREALKLAISTVEDLQNMVRSRFSMLASADRIITAEQM